MSDDQRRGLLYLFQRPFEPLNSPRGRAGDEVIFQKEGEEDPGMATRFGSANFLTVPLSILNIVDELQMAKKIPKGVPYSQFNPLHRAAANEITQQFMNPQMKENLWQVAAAIKDSVNEGLFIYALSYAIIRNPALDSRQIPPISEIFPNKFIPQNIIQQAKDKIETEDPSTLPEEIVIRHNIDLSGSDLNPEIRVAYWREDYGINSHHWHWHLVFPLEDTTHRDRKGELFFYMHNQMVARYNWERLSNGMNRVVKLDNWREPIPEGYEHQLSAGNSDKKYGSRQPNTTPQNITRRDIGLNRDVSISGMVRWRERLFDAISKGEMICAQTRQPVTLSDNVKVGPGVKRGIDCLGDTFEADEDLSLNYKAYGTLHNEGHDMIAYIHDPNGDNNEEVGVIGDAATALRDPVFYRWHKFVDDVFQEYKMKQVPYEDNELFFDVKVESVSVQSGTNDENVLETGWDYRRVDASLGLDFKMKGTPVLIDLQHLEHRSFLYNIQVENNKIEPVDVTVRLYMAPKLNEAGETMTFMDQRLLWAEMDRYHFILQPGSNSLQRNSTESSITIPEERTFRELEENLVNAERNDRLDPVYDYCGCGWPQHLLLPKGNAGGMDFQIFVLISDWELDKVERSTGKKTCSNAASFCGILDDKYPDARPMGYPFDRKPNTKINNVDISNATDFAQALPNALMTDIKIYFRGNDLNLG